MAHYSAGHAPEVVYDETVGLLSKEEAAKPDHSAWYWRIADQFTFERIKILLILLALLTSIVVFSLKRVEHDGGFNLVATRAEEPLIVPAAMAANRRVLETILSVQPAPTPQFPSPTTVSVCVQASTSGFLWNTIDPCWEVVADPQLELVEMHHDFFLDDPELDPYTDWRFMITTNSPSSLALTFHYRDIFPFVRYQVVMGALVLVLVYVLIVFELVHRTIAALIGSFVCIGVYSVLHARPTFFGVISWIDFETVGLLFGMMIMVGIFSNTGFFEFSAVKAYKLSRGNLWHLTLILCTFTAVVSAFLDNVTTILLLAPVTIRLCRVIGVPPEPLLIAEVMFSNIGGTATPIGDPPNIIIVNDPRVIAHPDITFATFTLHVTPGILLSAVVVFFYLYYQFKRTMKQQPHHSKYKEVDIWRRTSARINPNGGEEERRVREQLESYIKVLQDEIESKPEDDSAQHLDIAEMEEKYQIHDRPLFISSVTVLSVVVLFFFLHSWIEHQVELSLAWIAIMGAMVHLVVSGIREIEHVLEKVEFSTLIFFAGLFVLMRGLEELGVMEFVGDQVAHLIGQVAPGRTRLMCAILLIIWVSAIVSAFIDNIPYTTAMVPIVANLAEQLDLPLAPLIWALTYGTCLGGNGTLIGASANVVACGLAEQQGYPISFNYFIRTGFPVMLLSVSVCTIYLLLTHVLIPWY